MVIKKLIQILFLVLFIPFVCEATIIRVAMTGTDNPTCGADGDECATIDYAVNSRAIDGDTVFVENGIYYERISLSNSGSSGAIITIEGESEDGVIVDGSEVITAGNWIAAPSIDPYAYRQTSFTTEPGSMYVVSGDTVYDIPRCRISNCTTSSGYLGRDITQTSSWDCSNQNVLAWDGIEAAFSWASNTLYVRFGDNSDPGDKTIRYSPENGEVFDFNGVSYITIKNMTIRGAHRGIEIYGANSNNIIIDNVNIYATGREKIKIYSSAHTVEVKNGDFYGNGAWHLGNYKPGAHKRNAADCSYEEAVAEHIYSVYKNNFSTESASDQEDMGFNIINVGSNVSVHDSKIRDTLLAVRSGDGGEIADVYSNTVYDISSIALYCSIGCNVRYYDNLVYDTNIGMRLQSLHVTTPTRTAYYYNNRFSQPDGTGQQIRLHGSSDAVVDPVDIYIYHNSFSGGRCWIALQSEFITNGAFSDAIIVNNVIDCDLTWCGESGKDNSSYVETFAYNWYRQGSTAWPGGNNIVGSTEIWNPINLPVNFILPDGHAAKDSAIDITQQFTTDTGTYNALPWNLNNYGDDRGSISQYVPTITGVTLQ